MTSARWVKALTLLAMCPGLLMLQLDTTVVNLALPSVQRSLHADVGALQWSIDRYKLTFASLLLLGGILGDLFGRKRLFLPGLVGLGIMLFSLCCTTGSHYRKQPPLPRGKRREETISPARRS